MFSRTSEQQTLNTLRALHANGMLSGADMDDQIAADLLNGSSPQSRKGSGELTSTLVGVRKRETPTRLEPLKAAPHLELAAAARGEEDLGLGTELLGKPDGKKGGNLHVTDEYMMQLAADCENFNTQLQDNTAMAKDLMQKALLDLFLRTSQEQLPDCFLRSLPKFGKGASKMAGIFNRSLNKKKTENLIDRKEVPFELQIQDDVVEEISSDIEKVIEQEMKRCFGVVTTDMQKILKSVVKLKDRLEHLEETLLSEQTDLRVVKEKFTDAQEQTKELQERIGQLNQQAQEKETQMDILTLQVKRRNQMLDEQRTRFNKEVMRYRTKIYELKQRLDTGIEGSTTGRRNSLTTVGGEHDLSPTTHAHESVEVMEAVDAARRELKDQMLESIRKLKMEHAKDKKELSHQKKMAVEERDNEIYRLKMNIKSMDRIIEGEKRRLMKNRELELKEIQEKYEQKITALQTEIMELRKG